MDGDSYYQAQKMTKVNVVHIFFSLKKKTFYYFSAKLQKTS